MAGHDPADPHGWVTSGAIVAARYRTQRGVRAVGVVIGRYDHPTYLIRTATGETVAWSERLVDEATPAETEAHQRATDEVAAANAVSAFDDCTPAENQFLNTVASVVSALDGHALFSKRYRVARAALCALRAEQNRGDA